MARSGPWRGARALVVAGLAATLALAACSGSKSDSGDTDNSVLKVGVPVKILSIDPQGTQIGERTTIMVVQHVFDPLVSRGEDGKPKAMLAETWENPDPNTWVFHLRQGVKFQDGSPLTASDVKASLDTMFKAKTPLAPLWATVASVEASDDKTVVIKTSAPTGALLNNLSLAFVAKADQVGKPDINTKPIGTGPFKLDEFKSGERTVLTANADYWGDKPKVQRIELREIPEVAGRLTALETGEIDLTYDLPPDQLGQVKGFDNVTVKTVPSFNYYFVWFNNGKKPLNDPRVRQALWYAVDFSKVQRDLFGESATVAKAPVPQAAFGAAQLNPYAYDPQKAKDLLAQAGYPNGFRTSIQWSTECCANVRALTQTLISEWKKIGVEVQPQEKERGKWLDDLLALRWDINIQDNAIITGDSEYALGRLYTCAAKRLGYCSTEYDAAIKKAKQTLDANARAVELQHAQEILWRDAAGIFPLDLAANAAWRSDVTGFEPAPNNIPDFRNTSVSSG
jgi:peptide/nickel transport system substrate-binding protein